MSFEFTGAFMTPGITGTLETFENTFWWGRYEDQVWTGVVISGASRDIGNTGHTDVLRPGLLLGLVTNTNKVKQWDPTATDGSERIFGILGPASKMQRLGSNQDRWLGQMMVGGLVKSSRLLIPGQSNLGISGNAYEHYIRAQLYPRFQDSYLHGGNPFGGWTRVMAKTANYTVLEADNNTLFTNRGATGGVTFTLPATPKLGLRYGFYVVADQDLKVAAGTGDTLVTFNDAAADSVAFQTASEKIGGYFEVIGDGTGWLVISHLAAEAQTITVAT